MANYFDEEHLRHLFANTLLGTAAAALRGIKSKERWKPFVVRLIAGSLMAGVVAWLTWDLGLPPFIVGLICFASGYATQEIAAKISAAGKKATDEITKSKDDGDDDDN